MDDHHLRYITKLKKKEKKHWDIFISMISFTFFEKADHTYRMLVK